MTNFNIKLDIPELNAAIVKFCDSVLQDFSVCLLLLTHTLALRAQIAAIAASGERDKSVIQSYPSMRFLAGSVLTKHDVIRDMLATMALFSSAFFFARDYNAIENPEKKREFLNNIVKDILSSSGISRPLSPRQISSRSDVLVNCRGVMSKIRGTWQAHSVFYPGSFIRGMSVVSTGWQAYLEAFISLCDRFGLDYERHLRAYANEAAQLNLGSDVSIDRVARAIITDAYRGMIPTGDSLIRFHDGVNLSDNETNTVPLEDGLPIVRNRPTEIDPFEVDHGDDPFLKAAKDQMDSVAGRGVRNVRYSRPSQAAPAPPQSEGAGLPPAAAEPPAPKSGRGSRGGNRGGRGGRRSRS